MQIPERLRELCMEIYPLCIGPSGRIPVSTYGIISAGLYECLGRLVPASSVLKVYHDAGIIRLRECISVKSCPVGGSQFGSYAITQQSHAVISRACDLPCAVSIRP